MRAGFTFALPSEPVARVRVRLPAALRPLAGGAAQVDVDAGTLREALVALGPVASRVLDDAGAVRRHVHVFVNAAQARDLAAPLAEGDIIHVLPAVSGGSA